MPNAGGASDTAVWQNLSPSKSYVIIWRMHHTTPTRYIVHESCFDAIMHCTNTDCLKRIVTTVCFRFYTVGINDHGMDRISSSENNVTLPFLVGSKNSFVSFLNELGRQSKCNFAILRQNVRCAQNNRDYPWISRHCA